MAPAALALAFATIERPQVAQRLIRSARKHLGNLPIYVADQSRQIAAIAGFYAHYDVRLLRMPYDVGVTASRNRLAREIHEDYFLLCDDDFVFGPQTKFDDALHILETHPEIGVVGGKLYDFGWEEEWVRNWELFLQYDRQHKILFSIPIYELAPRARELGGIRYFMCDAVLNFAIFRRSMFSNGVQWDERFKSNGEHEDFFLALKVNSPYRVAYLPSMVAYHHHPAEYRAYISRLRERNEGWRRFFDKWGLEQHIELGLGVRTIDDFGTVVESADAKARFFANGDLSLQRTRSSSGTVLIGDFERLATVGVLNQEGSAPVKAATIGHLLLDRETQRVVAAPEAVGVSGSGDPVTSATVEAPFERYQLEASVRDQAVSSTDQDIYFRYDAVLWEDADFYLWYYCEAQKPNSDSPGHRLAVTVRWSGGNGQTIVWRSRRTFVDLQWRGYWQPLHLDVPLVPRGMSWLRFDLITDGGRSPDPLCTGFLFGGRTPKPRQLDAGSVEVLGLSRLPNDGANPGTAGKYLDELGRRCAERRVSLRIPSWAADMTLFETDQMPGLEALFFVGWEGFGRALVGARLPPAASSPPATLALPSTEWHSPNGRVYGYGRSVGFVRLSAAEAAAASGR